MSKAQILRKLTIASTGWLKGAIQEALRATNDGKMPVDGTEIPLMKIVGVTTMAKPGQTDKGEFLKLIGQFTAVNLDDGAVFNSTSCILPNFISDSLAAALVTSDKVEFAIEIGAEASAKSVSGYQFTVKPLMEAKPTVDMQRLLDLAGVGDALKLTDEPAKKAKK